MDLFLAFLAPVLATIGCAVIAWQLILVDLNRVERRRVGRHGARVGRGPNSGAP